MAAFINIAQDLTAPPPDVRDAAPENLRCEISSGFAAVLKRGMERQWERRLASADALASALHECLVQRGDELYTVFISYRVASERYHAMLLYEVLNNTMTPAGHRVLVYLDSRRLVKGEVWEQGFASGLLRSLVAVPLVSHGFLAPLVMLTGTENERRDNVALELLLMQELAEMSEAGVHQQQQGTAASSLEAIYPIFIGNPCPRAESEWRTSSTKDPGVSSQSPNVLHSYPRSGNFFQECAELVAAIPDVVSPPTALAAAGFLTAHGTHSTEAILTKTLRAAVQGLLTRQGAELWASRVAEPETLLPTSDVLQLAAIEQTEPALDAIQLGMIKAQMRTLVPGIHAVVDRAHSSLAGRKPVSFLQTPNVNNQSFPAGDIDAGLLLEGCGGQRLYVGPAMAAGLEKSVAGDVTLSMEPGKVILEPEQDGRPRAFVECPLLLGSRRLLHIDANQQPFKAVV